MTGPDSSPDYDLPVEEFNQPFRRGERPSVQAYSDRHPAVAARGLALVAVVLAGTAAVGWKWQEAEWNAVAARRTADDADASARRSQEEARRADRAATAVPFRPMTGTPVPELAAFDRAMQQYMRDRDIAAGTLAVMKDGKLVLSRGYGFADKEGKVRIAPDAPFRLASVSKPITAAAVRKLIRVGKLTPDTTVWDLLGLAPPPGKKADPRWMLVTVGHLLDHKGGWDRGVAGDPMFKSLLIAKALGKPGPATAEDVVAYMAGEPLQFDPGTKSVYSNFGYCVLGRVIEKVTGKTYIDYVRGEVLAPIGITRVTLGRTLPTDRDPAEPVYDDPGTGRNVMRPDQKEWVPAPDGTFHLEAMDAHGGLIGSANELVRFLTVYTTDGRRVGPRPTPGAFFGALPGTFTMLYQRGDGVAVVALFNRWHDPGGRDAFEIRRLIDEAADGIKAWPAGK